MIAAFEGRLLAEHGDETVLLIGAGDELRIAYDAPPSRVLTRLLAWRRWRRHAETFRERLPNVRVFVRGHEVAAVREGRFRTRWASALWALSGRRGSSGSE